MHDPEAVEIKPQSDLPPLNETTFGERIRE